MRRPHRSGGGRSQEDPDGLQGEPELLRDSELPCVVDRAWAALGEAALFLSDGEGEEFHDSHR